ncbi:hypothetical protein B0H19DRAFT_1219156 [Mycena capillaripes]|nr:hypothetical protein B0H19DRAFT_1219156 [Mycena capillaripes]
MNAPNRHELFVLEDGEKACVPLPRTADLEVADDTKIPDAATFKIVKQDHTLGRTQLLVSSNFLFAGYKTSHPLHPYIPPAVALEAAASRLIATLSSLEGNFRRKFSFKDGAAGVGVDMGTGGDPYGVWGAGKDYLYF